MAVSVKKMQKKFSLLLAILMLLSVFACVSCGKKDPASEVSDTLPPKVQETVPVDAYEANIPVLDLEGEKFNLLVSTQMQDFFLSTDAQDAVSVAAYKRNNAVQDRFDIVLNYKTLNGNTDGSQTYTSTIRNSCISNNDESFDLVVSQLFAHYLTYEGYFHNLYSAPNLHFEREWWYSNINEYGAINDRLYGVAGAFNMDKITATLATFFNKTMASAYGIDVNEIYTLVEEGKWSYEDLYRMATLVADNDTDSSGTLDATDKYGFASQEAAIGAMLTGFDIPISKVTDNEVEFLYMNDKHYRTFETVYGFFNETDCVYYTNDYDLPCEIFSEGRSLFYACDIVHISYAEFRSLSFEYGIAPMPKYTDGQEEYVSCSMRWDLTFVPITADFEKACIILENLNYETHNILIPEYWELAVPFKYSNDPRHVGILETIRKSVYWDFCEYWNLANVLFDRNNLIADKDKDVASWWAGEKLQLNTELQTLLTRLDEIAQWAPEQGAS